MIQHSLAGFVCHFCDPLIFGSFLAAPLHPQAVGTRSVFPQAVFYCSATFVLSVAHCKAGPCMLAAIHWSPHKYLCIFLPAGPTCSVLALPRESVFRQPDTDVFWLKRSLLKQTGRGFVSRRQQKWICRAVPDVFGYLISFSRTKLDTS